MLSNFHKEINLYLKNRGDYPYPKHIEYGLINANPKLVVACNFPCFVVGLDFNYFIGLIYIIYCFVVLDMFFNFNPLSSDSTYAMTCFIAKSRTHSFQLLILKPFTIKSIFKG